MKALLIAFGLIAIILLGCSTPSTQPLYSKSIVLSGVGSMTSAPFQMTTDGWILDWSYIPGSADPDSVIFSFFIYRSGETLNFVQAVMFAQETTGSTYSYTGKGEYYIKVAAANIDYWEIKIKPAE